MTSAAKKGNLSKDYLSVEEATQLLNEKAFMRLDHNMISFCFT